MYSNDLTQSVLSRLKAASFFIYLFDILIFAALGMGLFSEMLQGADPNSYASGGSSAPIISGLVIGGLFGAFVAYLETTFIDWLRQMLSALDVLVEGANSSPAEIER